MSTTAQRLLACNISHSYFEDGNWPALKIRPCPATRKRLLQKKLKFKTSSQGFEIALLPQGNPAPKTVVPVRILLYPAQAAYEVFTEIPFRMQSSTLYFSDQHPSLAPQSYPRAATLLPQVYPLRSNSFVWKQELPDETALQVKDDSGRAVGSPVSLRRNSAFIDLSFEPHSRFAMCNELEAPKWFVTGEAWGKRPMAILDLHLNLGQTAPDDLPSRTVHLEFKTRAVHWRYLLQTSAKSPHKGNLELVEARNRIQFMEEEPLEQSNPSHSVHLQAFRSMAPIPFQQRFPFDISVLRKDSGEVIAQSIAFPEADYLERETREDGQIHSIAQKWLILY